MLTPNCLPKPHRVHLPQTHATLFPHDAPCRPPTNGCVHMFLPIICTRIILYPLPSSNYLTKGGNMCLPGLIASQYLFVNPCQIFLYPPVVHPSLVPMGGTVAAALVLAAAAAAAAAAAVLRLVALGPHLALVMFPQVPRLIQHHQHHGCCLGGWCVPSSVPKVRERGRPEYKSGTLELPLVLALSLKMILTWWVPKCAQTKGAGLKFERPLCIECLLRALLALSAWHAVPHRASTTRGQQGLFFCRSLPV